MSAPDARPIADRERRLADTFVVLADTLVADFDLEEVHGRLVRACVDVLGAAAAGIMLSDSRGGLTVVAATTGDAAAVEALELQAEEGPCLDCFRTGEPVASTTLDDEARARWPRFTPFATERGYTTVLALPLRLRGRVLGALNVFGDVTTAMGPDDVRIAQALADVATIALLQLRAVSDSEHIAGQLQEALTTRVVIEQAKGLLAERGAISVDEAFDLLRAWAREHRIALGRLAHDLVAGAADADDVLAGRWPVNPPEG